MLVSIHLAELPAARFEGESPSPAAINHAQKLAHRSRPPTPSAFQQAVASCVKAAIQTVQHFDDVIRLRAVIRSQVATEWFTEQRGQPSRHRG